MRTSPVTIQEIARRARVSVGTASAVLSGRNGSVKRRDAVARAQRVRQVAERLGYRPDATARAMRSGRTGVVGVLVANAVRRADRKSHINIYEAILGLNHCLDQHGIITALIPFMDVVEADQQLPRLFRERMLDAMVVLSRVPAEAEARVDDIMEKVLWVDANRFDASCCIRRDEEAAGRVTVEHLVAAGCRELLMLSFRRESEHFSHAARQRGMLKAAEKAGVAHKQIMAVEAEPDATDLWARLRPEVGAVADDAYCCSWLVCQAAVRRLAPGSDYRVACCDDSQALSRSLPQVPRAVFDRYQMGWTAGEMLLRLLQQGPEACPSQMIRPQIIGGALPAPLQHGEAANLRKL